MRLAWIIVVATLIFIGLTANANETNCGALQKQTKVATVIPGRESTKGKWPWHMALFHEYDNFMEYICGGTLISSIHVLTAAHCTINRKTGYTFNKNNLVVYASTETQRRSVTKIFKFDNYTEDSHRYDIAILEVISAVEFNKYVQSAYVFSGQYFTGRIGTVIGWERTESGEPSSISRETQLVVVDTFACLNSDRAALGPSLEREMFCARYMNGTGLCKADIGSGLFFELNGAWYVGGIISFTEAGPETELSQTNGYAGFTKLYGYLPWIQNVTKLCEDELQNKFCTPKNASANNTDNLRKLPRQCGVYSPNRLNIGERTEVFEFPWTVLLFYEGEPESTGSLINKRYVLTAAYYVSLGIPDLVRLGEHTFGIEVDCNEDNDCAPPVRDIGVECVIIHQEFNVQIFRNDIALVRMAETIEFDDHIQPICLPTTSSLKEMELTHYIIIGWNDMEYSNRSLVLKKAIATVSNKSECQDRFTTDHLCARHGGGPRGCIGDTGAPLGYPVKFHGTRFVQFGISSFGWNCIGPLSIYTKVSSYIDWILANIEPMGSV